MNNFTEIPLLFNLIDASGKKIPSKGLYSIDSYYLNFTVEKDTENNIKSYTKSFRIQLEPCDRDKHLGKYKSLFENIIVEDYMCVPCNKYNLTIFGNFGDLVNGFSGLSIHVSKCDNSTENCYSEEIINKKLSNVFFIFIHVSFQIDHYNHKNPKQIKLESSAFMCTYYLLKRYMYYLTPITYETNYGFLFDEIKQEVFFLYDSYALDVDFRSANVINPKSQLTSIDLRNTNYKGDYKRSYVNFTSIAAYVGGLINLIITVCQFINYVLTQNLVIEKISSHVFNFEGKKEISSQNLKSSYEKVKFFTPTKVLNPLNGEREM
jgi:hypothetical protein